MTLLDAVVNVMCTEAFSSFYSYRGMSSNFGCVGIFWDYIFHLDVRFGNWFHENNVTNVPTADKILLFITSSVVLWLFYHFQKFSDLLFS